MWLKETINSFYNTGLSNDKLCLLNNLLPSHPPSSHPPHPPLYLHPSVLLTIYQGMLLPLILVITLQSVLGQPGSRTLPYKEHEQELKLLGHPDLHLSPYPSSLIPFRVSRAFSPLSMGLYHGTSSYHDLNLLLLLLLMPDQYLPQIPC